MHDPRDAGSSSRDRPRARLVGLAIAAAVVVVGMGWLGAAAGVLPVAPGGPRAVTGSGEPSQVASGPSVSPDPSSPEASAVPTASASIGVSATPVELDPVFGMSGHLMWRDVDTAVRQLDLLAADGLGVVRFDVSWRGLEPEQGTYAWLDKLDDIVDATVARGIRPVVTIIETPAWANGGQSVWHPPSDPADYAAFAGMLAGRYAGRVDAWEIWNEPDTELFWRPSPDAHRYADLLVAASAAIRAANPAATVVSAGVTFGNTAFLEDLYAHGVKGSFDALAVHPYTLTRAPDDESDRFYSLTGVLDDVRAVMEREGDPKPIWVTEFGWAVTGLNSVSAAQRVDYLARAVELLRDREWVEVVAMYTINTADSERYGLSTDGRRSAAWESYVEAVRTSGR